MSIGITDVDSALIDLSSLSSLTGKGKDARAGVVSFSEERVEAPLREIVCLQEGQLRSSTTMEVSQYVGYVG